MNRVVYQLKRKIDGIDFRKIYYNFDKMPFVVKNNSLIYDLNTSYKDLEILNNKVIINGDSYIVLDVTNQEINFNELTMELILLMFKSQNKRVKNIVSELKYFKYNKTNDYYILKYQECLYAAGALKNNNEYLQKFISINNFRQNDTFVKQVENKIESLAGIEKYVKLKLLEIFNKDEYIYELQLMLDTLEDPCKLVNYIQYEEIYSAVYLLLTTQAQHANLKYSDYTIDKPLFNFDNLISESESCVKKILMHKMINAKKSYIKGKLIYAKMDKAKVCGNLFYFQDQITILLNNRVINKKGDFIVKLNDLFEIEEAYECFLISKILA